MHKDYKLVCCEGGDFGAGCLHDHCTGATREYYTCDFCDATHEHDLYLSSNPNNGLAVCFILCDTHDIEYVTEREMMINKIIMKQDNQG